jgi:hypothetical protein
MECTGRIVAVYLPPWRGEEEKRNSRNVEMSGNAEVLHVRVGM